MRQEARLWGSWTRHRDEGSFEALVLPELGHALGFARRLGCDVPDAEDAVQDALARLVTVRDDSPMALGLRAWLCREVHVRARSRLRSERRRKSRERAVAAGASVPASGLPAVRDEVDRALSGLDEEEQVAVQLRYLHDLDYAEIAVVLGASEGACRKKVHKALGRLRARFGGNAAAMLAALPLPGIVDASAWIRGALGKSAATSAAVTGATVMATTTQKVMLAAVLAAGLGAGATWGVGRALDASATTARPTDGAAPAPPESPRTARAGPRAVDVATAEEIAGLRSRAADLERLLAEANAKAAELDAMDPMAVLVYSRRPLSWKAARLLEIEDERARWTAIGKVATVLSEREGSAREFLAALETETDPRIVEMLEKMVSGSLGKASADDRRAFRPLLRGAPLPATRAAAVAALFMSEQFRGGVDPATKGVASEMNGHVLEALRTEAAPEVVGSIAHRIAAWFPPPEWKEALRAAAERLPPSPGRRQVWEAIARGMGPGDAVGALFREFEATANQDRRDDIAAGIGRAANSMSGGSVAKEVALSRFRALYGGTSDPAVRTWLLRGAFYGLGCVALTGKDEDRRRDTSKFLRETAAQETDAALRAKIERLVAVFEPSGTGDFQEADRILFAKD